MIAAVFNHFNDAGSAGPGSREWNNSDLRSEQVGAMYAVRSMKVQVSLVKV